MATIEGGKFTKGLQAVPAIGLSVPSRAGHLFPVDEDQARLKPLPAKHADIADMLRAESMAKETFPKY